MSVLELNALLAFLTFAFSGRGSEACSISENARDCVRQHFLRELFENIGLPVRSQAQPALTFSIPLQGIAQRTNFKERPAQSARATQARRRVYLLGLLQWLVLCGVPYRGPGDAINAISTDPTNQLPTSLDFSSASPNRGRPNGHREAPLLHYCNFLRVPQGTLLCNSQRQENPSFATC